MDINQLNKAYAEQYAKDHKLEERYTAPKELSDDEILQIRADLTGTNRGAKEAVLKFARAILKKASEK